MVHNLTLNFLQNYAAILECGHDSLSLGKEPRMTIPIALEQQPVLCKALCAAYIVHSLQCFEMPARSVQVVIGTVDVSTLPIQ